MPIEEQIACVERELGFRERLYPRWVLAQKLTQEAADLELARLRAVRATLVGLNGPAAPVSDAEAVVRRSERQRVLEVIGRNMHSGQYLRVEAAVRRELGA